MTRKLTIIILAALATLAAPAAAQAEFRPADSYPELGQVLPIARAAWPDSPCTGHEQIQLVAPPMIRDGEHAIGRAYKGTCNLELEMSILGDASLLCRTMTHEFGHLAGNWFHSDDPLNVMNPATGYWQPCIALGAPVATPPPVAPEVEPVVAQPDKPTTRATKPQSKRKHQKHRRTKCSRKHTRKARRACRREQSLRWIPDR